MVHVYACLDFVFLSVSIDILFGSTLDIDTNDDHDL